MAYNCPQELPPLPARIVFPSLLSIFREPLANPLVRPVSPNDAAFDLHHLEVAPIHGCTRPSKQSACPPLAGVLTD